MQKPVDSEPFEQLQDRNIMRIDWATISPYGRLILPSGDDANHLTDGVYHGENGDLIRMGQGAIVDLVTSTRDSLTGTVARSDHLHK